MFEVELDRFVDRDKSIEYYLRYWRTDIEGLISGRENWSRFYRGIDSLPAALRFGTSGIRGTAAIVDKPELTSLHAYALGKALRSIGKKLVIAHDCRVSNTAISYGLASGFISQGGDVHYLGYATTGNVQWAIRVGDSDIGAMITAPHNPPPDNGIKVFGSDGIELSDTDTNIVQKRYLDIYRSFKLSDRFDSFLEDKIPIIDRNRVIIDDTPKYSYVSRIREEFSPHLDRLHKLMDGDIILIDAGHSVGSMYIPEIFAELDTKVLFGTMDGMFPGRHSEPTTTNLHRFLDYINDHDVFLGFAIDGDADRCVFAVKTDEKAVIPNLNDLASLFILAGLKEYSHIDKKPFVAKTTTTTELAVAIAKKFNAKIVETPVGARFLGNTLVEAKKNGMFPIVGVEESAGIVYEEFTAGKDGFFAFAKLLKYLAGENKRLEKALQDLKDYGVYHRFKTNVKLRDNSFKQRLLQECEIILRDRNGKIEYVREALKFISEDGWIVVRASGTEPKFRIYAEAKNPRQIDNILTKIIAAVNRYAEHRVEYTGF